MSTASIEPWIVPEDGSDTGQDGIASAALAMDETMGGWSGDAAVPVVGGDQRAATGLCPLGRHPGKVVEDAPFERLVQPSHQRNVFPHLDLHARGSEPFESARGDRVTIATADHDPGDACGDHGVDARWRSAVVIAWFQRDPHGAASSVFARDGQCRNLRMRAARWVRSSIADPVSLAVGDDAAHRRIRFGLTMAPESQPSGAFEHRSIEIGIVHDAAGLGSSTLRVAMTTSSPGGPTR